MAIVRYDAAQLPPDYVVHGVQWQTPAKAWHSGDAGDLGAMQDLLRRGNVTRFGAVAEDE